MMDALPSPEKMASLVSGITETMLGFSFTPVLAPDLDAQRGLTWRTAVLPIAGARPITVGISSDEKGCGELSAAMFSCPRDAVDTAMMNDSLCEILNMTAGLLKSVMALDQALGLPRILPSPDRPEVPSASPHVVVLRAERVGLVLWVYEGVPSH